MGLPATLGQHDVVLPPSLSLRNTRGLVGLTTVLQQQPQSHMPPHVFANYAMGTLQVSFFFRVELPTHLLIYVCVCYGVYYLLSGSILDAIFTNKGSTVKNLHHCSPLGHTHDRHMCVLMMVISPNQECTKWLLPPLFQVGGALCYSAVLQPFGFDCLHLMNRMMP